VKNNKRRGLRLPVRGGGPGRHQGAHRGRRRLHGSHILDGSYVIQRPFLLVTNNGTDPLPRGSGLLRLRHLQGRRLHHPSAGAVPVRSKYDCSRKNRSPYRGESRGREDREKEIGGEDGAGKRHVCPVPHMRRRDGGLRTGHQRLPHHLRRTGHQGDRTGQVPVRQGLGSHQYHHGRVFRHSAVHPHQRLRHRGRRGHRRAGGDNDGGVPGQSRPAESCRGYTQGRGAAVGHPVRGLRPCGHDRRWCPGIQKLLRPVLRRLPCWRRYWCWR
jgi:hypothetical protein